MSYNYGDAVAINIDGAINFGIVDSQTTKIDKIGEDTSYTVSTRLADGDLAAYIVREPDLVLLKNYYLSDFCLKSAMAKDAIARQNEIANPEPVKVDLVAVKVTDGSDLF